MKRLVLPLIVLLFCFVISPSIASSQKPISSYGMISYSSQSRLVGCIIADPEWKWTNYGEWLEESHLDLIRDSGANAVKLFMNKWAWDTNVWLPNLGMSHRERMQQIVGWCRARGLNVILEMHVATQDEEDWEAQWQTKAEVIMNESSITTQDSWINTCKSIVQTLNPDGIGPFNEPPAGYDYWGDTTYSQAELFDAYWPFILRTVQAIHSISPNTTCYVESCPFWDLQFMIDKPLPEPNVVYEIHPYQADGFACPEITDALSRGDFDEARRLYRLNILEHTAQPDLQNIGWSVQDAFDKGLEIFCGECGTNIFQTEWRQFMQIHYDLMKELGIGFVQLQLDGNSATTGSNYFGFLVNPDAASPELNEVGLLWQQNMY